MRAIVTVVGKDKVGIIARVTGFLSDLKLNVEDISQTILQDFFVMMMLIAVPESAEMANIQEKLDALGKELAVSIRVQHEDIFNAMHRI